MFHALLLTRNVSPDAMALFGGKITSRGGRALDEHTVYQTLWYKSQLGAGLAPFYTAFRARPKRHPFARIILPRNAIVTEKAIS